MKNTSLYAEIKDLELLTKELKYFENVTKVLGLDKNPVSP